jgi:hypothetical protein
VKSLCCCLYLCKHERKVNCCSYEVGGDVFCFPCLHRPTSVSSLSPYTNAIFSFIIVKTGMFVLPFHHKQGHQIRGAPLHE